MLTLQNDTFALTALSPLDGRYRSQLQSVADCFSEAALIHQRVKVEIEYLLFLADHELIPKLTSAQRTQLQKIVSSFDESDAQAVKKLEQETKHDVKAVEYFLRKQVVKLKIPVEQYIHIGLTSEDTNSLAHSLLLKEAKEKIIVPQLDAVLQKLATMAEENQSTVMLARTHGQPAVPTTLGKELIVFAMRLYDELLFISDYEFEAKVSGAVGTFSAQQLIFDRADWMALSHEFVSSLGLKPTFFTTQIVSAETYTRFFGSLVCINGILLDLDQDMWRYISDGYFTQTTEKNQVGSSTMPQKINPIDFENSEGNLGVATALLTFFIQKLPVSRLQRDLSDSTVKRSFGTAIGHCYLAYQSLLRGLGKVKVNHAQLEADLGDHWEVVTEALQVTLRANGDTQGYEKLKTFAQGKKIEESDLREFIASLSLDDETKEKLTAVTPFTYVGLATEIVTMGLSTINDYLQGDA